MKSKTANWERKLIASKVPDKSTQAKLATVIGTLKYLRRECRDMGFHNISDAIADIYKQLTGRDLP